jgi:hypothetical protein
VKTPPAPGGLDLDSLRSAAGVMPGGSTSELDTLPPPIRAAILDAEPVKPVSADLGSLTNVFVPAKSSKELPAPPKSIAMQVDEIVQERLPASPFNGRTITVRDHPKKGIVVLVDDKQYEGVGDVAEADVRAFLQECVRLWEQR